MIVTVKLFANLPRRYHGAHRPGEPFRLELPDGATVADALAQLGLPGDQVKVTFVNGRARPREHVLEPEDEFGVFPPIGGG